MAPRISAVIPVHNEAGNIAPLHRELITVLPEIGSYEIIYINDGSTDSSAKELAELQGCIVIELNRCYGQATALDAGFSAASGELVVSLDGDGQNDPRDIPKLVAALEERRLDVVAGWRKVRSDTQGIRVLTMIGRTLRRLIIKDPVHDTGCTLRVYRREAVQSISLGGEMHRYLLALLRWKGFCIGEVVVHDRPRVHGRSNYGYDKAVRGFIDLIYVWFLYKYSDRPLHLFGYFSLTSCALAFLALCMTLYDLFVLHLHLNHDGWFYLFFFSGISGILFFSFGLVIDLLLKVVLTMSKAQKPYEIRSIYKR